MSNDSPVVETSAVLSTQQEPGQANETTDDESAKSTTEAQAATEEGTEDQTGSTTQDENGKNGNTNEGDTSKWIGKRLERAKAQERANAQTEIDYWRNAAMAKAGTVDPGVQSQAASDKPSFSDYNDVETFTDALTDWKIDQKLKDQAQRTHIEKVHNTYQERVTEFVKKTPDFEKVVQDFINTYKNENVPELSVIAFESEVGPQLVHYLATSETEMERIIALPSHRRNIELGKLEDKLKGNAAPVAKEPKISKAPVPITKENGSAVVVKSITDRNLTQAEHRAIREKQKKRF